MRLRNDWGTERQVIDTFGRIGSDGNEVGSFDASKKQARAKGSG